MKYSKKIRKVKQKKADLFVATNFIDFGLV